MNIYGLVEVRLPISSLSYNDIWFSNRPTLLPSQVGLHDYHIDDPIDSIEKDETGRSS